MDSPAFRALTNAEKEALRLVRERKTSKEIARILGISKPTVDQRIDGARRKLGDVSRVHAAEMLAAHEGAGLPDPIAYGPIRLPDQPPLASPEPQPNGWQSLRPWPTREMPTNELASGQRIILIIACAIIGLLAVVLLISVMSGLGAITA